MNFLHSGAIYAAANIASAGVPFLLLPLLTRVLGPVEYGHVVSFTLLVTLCLTVAGLNAHAALGVVWFQRPHAEIPAFTGTALAIVIVSTLLVAPLVAGAIWLFPQLGGGLSAAWGAMAALTAGCNVLLQCRLVLWQSQKRPLPSACLQVVASVLNVGLSLVAVLVFGWGGDGRIAGIAGAAILSALIALGLFFASHEVRWAPAREQLRTLIAFGLPLILHTLAGVLLGSADRLAVSIQLDAYALGIYGAGAQLGMVMSILADAFVKAYSPWIYGKLTSAHEGDRHCAVGAIYASMPAFFVLAALVGVTLVWASSALLGPQYRAAAGVLPWFMLGGAFFGVYLSTSGLYFFSGRTALLASVTLSSTVLGAALTWVLVATIGVDGAAMAYALTNGILALVTTLVAMRSYALPWSEPRRALTAWSRCVVAARQQPSTL